MTTSSTFESTKKKGASAKRGIDDPRPHAIVIGSGFGGLAAAVRLGARGYRVTVLEKLDAPGGRAYVHRQDGHTFDAGPTVITAPFLLEELWSLAGKKFSDEIDLREVSPFYRILFSGGERFEYTGDADQMRAEVRRLSPRDVAGYDRFVEHSERIFRVGFEELAHKSFSSPLDMARIAPDMIRLESFRSVYGLVSKYISDERVRQVVSFHPLLVGGNPFTTTSIYTLIAFLERKWGVHFPMGGTGALVKGLVGLIEHQGGAVKLDTEVRRIVVEDRIARGVVLASGEVMRADVVVSNNDSGWTYRHLIDEKDRPTWSNRKIERTRFSMSLFVWYFGTATQYPDVAHHTILLGPRYKGLLDDIFANKVLADDFSLYLHRPTATDPSLAPEGRDTFYVLSPVPNLAGKTNWLSEAEIYRKKIEAHLDKTLLPGLSRNLTTSRIMTPLDFQDRLLSFRGAAFGVEPVLTQSAYFRPHNRSEDIEHLYLVGAGTHPGAGLPGVLSSARVLDEVVPSPSVFRRA